MANDEFQLFGAVSQQFTAEEEVGSLYTYVEFEDGLVMDISRENLDVTSQTPSLEVSSTNGQPVIYVASGAESKILAEGT